MRYVKTNDFIVVKDAIVWVCKNDVVCYEGVKYGIEIKLTTGCTMNSCYKTSSERDLEYLKLWKELKGE